MVFEAGGERVHRLLLSRFLTPGSPSQPEIKPSRRQELLSSCTRWFAVPATKAAQSVRTERRQWNRAVF